MPHCCRFDSINGMLIPGGSADLKPGHPFYDATEYIFKLALEANDKGDYFPVSHSCTDAVAKALLWWLSSGCCSDSQLCAAADPGDVPGL